jgi:hypothetical protein
VKSKIDVRFCSLTPAAGLVLPVGWWLAGFGFWRFAGSENSLDVAHAEKLEGKHPMDATPHEARWLKLKLKAPTSRITDMKYLFALFY